MDASAIKQLQSSHAFDIDALQNTDIESVIIPDNALIKSLEHLKLNPYRFIGTFNTHIPAEFTEYCTKNLTNQTAIYIDSDAMNALAVINHGDEKSPEWGDHRAEIKLRKKPDYSALINQNNQLLEQQDLIDFLTDWGPQVAVFDSIGEVMPLQTAFNRIRKLSINQLKNVESEIGDFSAKKSAMESVEIKSGGDELPGYFTFTVMPYEGFNAIELKCQLQAKTDGTNVLIKFRIESLQMHEQDIADEFRELIKSEIPDNTLVYIGNIKLR